MIQILVKNKDGSFDITQLVATYRWSGDIRQCARSLDLWMLNAKSDRNVPQIDVSPGTQVALWDDGALLFIGMAISCQKSTTDSITEITAYDGGIRLKTIQDTMNVSGQTPEQFTKAICKKYQIPFDSVAETGVTVTRNFFGITLYQMIQTMYTLASQKNQKKYFIVFRGTKLCVEEKKPGEETLLLENGVNLIDATKMDSIQNMVNQVIVYDKDDHPMKTIANDASKKLYGLMQRCIKKGETENVMDQANKILRDQGLEQKITVNCLGNTCNTTGGTVIVHEPFTGVYGLFFIDSDIHEWKNGQYFNKLSLNFQNIMDEQEAGSLIQSATKNLKGKKPKKAKEPKEMWSVLPEWEGWLNEQ